MSFRIALITGAARGIGAAIARRLAKDGFDITINDLPSKIPELESLQKEISSMGRRVYIHTADVSDTGEVENMVDSTVKTLGGIDVMVANAGIGWVSPLTECTEDIWDRIMAVNARGVFLCYKYAAKAMIAQGRGGRIIAASSVLGKQVPPGTSLRSAYCASKFAVRGLTQSAAQELGKHGITVNAYAPGPIDTPINDELGLDEAAKEAYIANDIKGTVVGRIGEPDEVASLVSYLASKESGFMTGQTVSINGGYFFD
ncbi:NAD(P)-binding protein [Macrolepiota fuliginosa MF-IS2]|uniref:NAD(P)-binding protein n=1 Tax=Macrolepiota fuliginosa MF-IS2 TaxID=1400762 RepID=A0A9P6C0X8_9AGAR|nr:NAD(P)-binding protein [Macrolepiota fuliginosa MF-IS2]